MSHKKTLDEHIAAGTFRMDRHSHLLKKKSAGETASAPPVDTEKSCICGSIFVCGRCTPELWDNMTPERKARNEAYRFGRP